MEWTLIQVNRVECASASHRKPTVAIWRMEADGVGSHYCDECRAAIEKQARELKAVAHGPMAEHAKD